MKFIKYLNKLFPFVIICFCCVSQINAQQIDIKRGNILKSWKYKLSTEDDSEYRSIYNRKRPLIKYFENDTLLLEKYLDYLVLNDYKRAANFSGVLLLVSPFLINEVANSNNFGVIIITATILVGTSIIIAPILAIVQHFSFKSVMRKYNRQYYNNEDIEIIFE